jgi:hypothetical protein
LCLCGLALRISSRGWGVSQSSIQQGDPRASHASSGDTFLGQTFTFFGGREQLTPTSSWTATFRSTQIVVEDEKLFTFAGSVIETVDKNSAYILVCELEIQSGVFLRPTRMPGRP